jgi:hypothetical protein
MNGKGSKRRPTDEKKFSHNYDSIFGSKSEGRERASKGDEVKIKLPTRRDESVSIDQQGKTLILNNPCGDEVEIEFKGRTLKIHDMGYRAEITLSVDGVDVWSESTGDLNSKPSGLVGLRGHMYSSEEEEEEEEDEDEDE